MWGGAFNPVVLVLGLAWLSLFPVLLGLFLWRLVRAEGSLGRRLAFLPLALFGIHLTMMGLGVLFTLSRGEEVSGGSFVLLAVLGGPLCLAIAWYNLPPRIRPRGWSSGTNQARLPPRGPIAKDE